MTGKKNDHCRHRCGRSGRSGVALWLLLRGGSGSEGASTSSPSAMSMLLKHGAGQPLQRHHRDPADRECGVRLLQAAQRIGGGRGRPCGQGDPLFTYDTQSTQLQIQQAQLEIERMNTTISNNNTQISQLQRDMNAASSADKPGFSAQILQLQADNAQAEYDIKSKQAEIDKLNAAIDSATVTAGMDGTVESIADLETLLAGGITNPDGTQSTTYITILADGDYRVKGSVSEQNIYELSEGMSVIVRSRVDENQTWSGTISSIDTQAESNNNNMYSSSGESASSYAFYVDLASIDGLMLGQHVTIEMDYGQGTPKEGIWLSSGWITQQEDGTARLEPPNPAAPGWNSAPWSWVSMTATWTSIRFSPVWRPAIIWPGPMRTAW